MQLYHETCFGPGTHWLAMSQYYSFTLLHLFICSDSVLLMHFSILLIMQSDNVSCLSLCSMLPLLIESRACFDYPNPSLWILLYKIDSAMISNHMAH
jgi:hypothetical protein